MKPYVFTVIDKNKHDKKLVWVQSASDKDLYIPTIMEFIDEWCLNNDIDILNYELEFLASAIYHGRSGIYLNRYIFDFSKVND